MEIISKRPGALPASLESLKIGKVLGKGGFAVVRSGQLKTSEGVAYPVAVKVLHPEYFGETSQELRLFTEEAELMLQLDHRNIITAYGLLKLQPNFPGLEGHTKPAYALVLEKMEGGSLARLMVKQLLSGAVPKYTFSQALGWLIDVARALHYLHNGGSDGFPRIHRDIKLENVLLTAGMKTAKLADFGLQRAIFAQQPERQQAMMVRRTTRHSLSLPRSVATPTGLSRLAPESERTSQRQSSAVRLQLQLTPSQPVPTDRLSSPTGLVAEPLTQPCSSGVADDLLSGDALFYSVDKDGLTPVVLPNSPQPQSRPATSPTAALKIRPDSDLRQGPLGLQPQLSSRTERGREISRRSRSMSHLDHVTTGPWPTALVAVPSSARDGAAGAAAQSQLQPNGQLVSAASAVGARSNSSNMNIHHLPLFKGKSGVQLPPLPVFQVSPGGQGIAAEPSPRNMMAVHSSITRLSPLGQSQQVRCADSLTDATSRLNEDSLLRSYGEKKAAVVGGGVYGGLLGPVRSPADAVPKIVVTESMRVRLADVSPSTPRTPTSDETTPNAALHSPLVSSVNTPCTTRQSPTGGLTQASSPHGAVAVGQGLTSLEGAPPSHASLGEVVLESRNFALQPQEQPQQEGAATSPQPCDLQKGNIRSIGSTVPVVCGGDGSGIASPAVAAAAGFNELQRLNSANNGPGNGVRGPNAYSGSSGAGGGLPGDVLRPAAQLGNCGNAVPRIAIDCAAKVECLPEALASIEVEVTVAQRPVTVSGMTSAAVAAEHQQSSMGRVAGSDPAVPPLLLNSCLASGGGAATSPGVISPAGSSHFGNQANQHPRPQIHMSDLLHLRLGTRNVSVRSLRSSASGTLSRQPIASAPTSPRLAVVSRAAGSQPETTPGISAAGTAAVAAPCSTLRISNVGSVLGTQTSGRLPSMGIRSLGAAADFDEVFSLTGRTGSLMYLAPEAYKREPYNDKVDVYSMGILMYELFGRTNLTFTHISTKLPAFSRMLCNPGEFAERVAAGYRPPRTNQMMKMPPELWELIEASWHQDPVQRPDIGSVLAALEDLVGPLAAAEASIGQGYLGWARCGCVIC